METRLTEFLKDLDALKAKYQESLKPIRTSGWKKSNTDKWLMYYDFENKKRYGFDVSGLWYTDTNLIVSSIKNEATHTEVQQALEMEAVKRGFKEGVDLKVNFNEIAYLIDVINGCFGYSKKYNELHLGNRVIFRRGEWAEIVKETSLDELAASIHDFHYATSGGLKENLVKYFSNPNNKTKIIETLSKL